MLLSFLLTLVCLQLSCCFLLHSPGTRAVSLALDFPNPEKTQAEFSIESYPDSALLI